LGNTSERNGTILQSKGKLNMVETGFVVAIVAAILLGLFLVLLNSNTDIPPNAERPLDPDSDQFKREEFVALVAKKRKNNG
jgi:hypothetical protein